MMAVASRKRAADMTDEQFRAWIMKDLPRVDDDTQDPPS
ncbi:MAG: hypothetical protein QOI91_2660 [Solirubrobacteraceae bacterium]|jgi:hypothetical protein|nr:hypothetical protein [Solirubrobacteraceae bacterium]